jgi:hypothetical protein
MSTATTNTPTAPLPTPAAAALARLESAFPAALAEQHRIERAATALHAGESTVINGTPVTAVSLEVAEALTRYQAESVHVVQLAALAESGRLSDLQADDLAHAEDLRAGALATLAEAGALDLIGLTAELPRSVVRYGILLARVAELTMKDRLTPAEFNGLADAQAELDRLHEQLEQAGQLRLVSS